MKKRAFSRLMFGIALGSLLLAFALIFLPTGETLVLFSRGDPAETVDAFFRCIESGDHAAASALCSPALSPEKPGEEADAASVYEALCRTRHWQGCESVSTHGSYATVSGRFTAADIAALTAGLREDVNREPEAQVAAARTSGEIYNEDGSYRDEVVMAAWNRALSARLEHAEDYCTTSLLTLTLCYREGVWQLRPDEALLRALAGGAS